MYILYIDRVSAQLAESKSSWLLYSCNHAIPAVACTGSRPSIPAVAYTDILGRNVKKYLEIARKDHDPPEKFCADFCHFV